MIIIYKKMFQEFGKTHFLHALFVILFQLGIYIFHYKQRSKIMEIYCQHRKAQWLVKAFVLLFPIIFANLESFCLKLKINRKEKLLNQ